MSLPQEAGSLEGVGDDAELDSGMGVLSRSIVLRNLSPRGWCSQTTAPRIEDPPVCSDVQSQAPRLRFVRLSSRLRRRATNRMAPLVPRGELRAAHARLIVQPPWPAHPTRVPGLCRGILNPDSPQMSIV